MKTWVIMMSCGLLLLSGCDSEDSGMSFDDLQQLDQSEQSELLALSEQAANNWNFSSAEDYLSQAEEKGYAPDTIDHTKQVIRKQRQAYRKDQERKAEARRRAEQRRLAQAQRSGGGTSGGNIDYVIVNFESVCGIFLCYDKDLSMSGGPGTFTNNAGASGTITKGYNGLVGNYHWVGSFDNKVCSGTVHVSGRKRTLTIRVYDDCRDAGTSEF